MVNMEIPRLDLKCPKIVSFGHHFWKSRFRSKSHVPAFQRCLIKSFGTFPKLERFQCLKIKIANLARLTSLWDSEECPCRWRWHLRRCAWCRSSPTPDLPFLARRIKQTLKMSRGQMSEERKNSDVWHSWKHKDRCELCEVIPGKPTACSLLTAISTKVVFEPILSQHFELLLMHLEPIFRSLTSFALNLSTYSAHCEDSYLKERPLTPSWQDETFNFTLWIWWWSIFRAHLWQKVHESVVMDLCQVSAACFACKLGWHLPLLQQVIF